MKKNLSKLFSKFTPMFFLIALFPFVASAQTACAGAGISKLICQAQQILGSIVPILITLGVVYFIWGVIKYVIAGGEEDKKKGREIMIYGLIGLTVIIGLWGIVNMVVTFLGGAGTAPSLVSGTGGNFGCNALTSTSTFGSLLGYITCLINNSIIPLIFAAATVMFIWGAIKFFIINADEEAKREQGKQYMIWGIIALAVMLSVWGLVGILSDTFGINHSILPQVCPPGSPNCASSGGGGGGGYDCSVCTGGASDPIYCATQCSGG